MVRVGITGYSHEANGMAPPRTRFFGIDLAAMPGGIAASWEGAPFVDTLRSLRTDVEIVEMPTWEIAAGGPMVPDDFELFLREMETALVAAGHLDAVLVLGHGAAVVGADEHGLRVDLDPDGTYLALLRRHLGPGVPVVAVLDLHANVSPTMVECIDVVVGYKTNPHTDVVECSRVAAHHVHAMLDGLRTQRVWCRLPLVLPQMAQNTIGDAPLGAAISAGAAASDHEVLDLSVFGAFSLGDTPDTRVSVVATVRRGSTAAGERAVRAAADVAWGQRHRYRTSATPVAEAVRLAADTSRRWLLADMSDNPGGGAPGNTVHVVRALHEAGVPGVQSGLHIDRDLVDEAWELGVGATFTAVFNRRLDDPIAGSFAAAATVRSLHEGEVRPTVGVYAGATHDVGRACCLDLGGMLVGVASFPRQAADPDIMRHVGLHPEAARVVVVKSRGHFRAGFAGMFPDEAIVEVDAPGLAPNDLRLAPMRHIVRPSFPLDADAEWDGSIEVVGD